jgi:hypothetical protein
MQEQLLMHVALAQPVDLPAWLDLAAEVEFLFGPMIADSGFHAALERNIARQTAFCVREQDGAPGRPLMGALLFSAANLSVVTFGEENLAGRPARHFYERMGFQSAEAAPNGPEGGSRQIFRRQFE